MVPRPTPSALASSATVMSRASYRARASVAYSGESLAGRPPTAAGSAINARSKSASAATM
jgi:hypothetical protein